MAEGETVVAFASAQLLGDGYYLVTAEGGVHTFGAAPFFGAPASGPVPHPIVDFGLTPSGHAHGDAPHLGSLPGVVPPDRLAAPVVAMLRSGPGREL